jgi:hypothetical protein
MNSPFLSVLSQILRSVMVPFPGSMTLRTGFLAQYPLFLATGFRALAWI